jgi:hypothetical protein
MNARIRTDVKSARQGFMKMRLNAVSAAHDAVEDHIKEVFDETQVRVPKETGALAGTGHIEKNLTLGGKVSSKIWYGEEGEGKGVIDYAAAVHEILQAKHIPPTGAKFVEQPLIESIGRGKEITAHRWEDLVKESFKK